MVTLVLESLRIKWHGCSFQQVGTSYHKWPFVIYLISDLYAEDCDAYFFLSASQCKFNYESEDPSCPSERYLLYREWAHPRSIYKKQPLDLIR